MKIFSTSEKLKEGSICSNIFFISANVSLEELIFVRSYSRILLVAMFLTY